MPAQYEAHIACPKTGKVVSTGFVLRVPNKMKNPTYTQWHLHPSQGGKGCHDRWSMTDCGN
jgi:hypothetical protein